MKARQGEIVDWEVQALGRGSYIRGQFYVSFVPALAKSEHLKYYAVNIAIADKSSLRDALEIRISDTIRIKGPINGQDVNPATITRVAKANVDLLDE